MAKNLDRIRNLCIGAVLSLIFTWCTAYFFVDSLVPSKIDNRLGFSVIEAGTKVYHRSEGWGVTTIGQDGIVGQCACKNDSAGKIVIWGNSYVLGLQLDDDKKMSARLNTLLEKNHIHNMVAIQIGNNGEHVSDYWFKIPKYEAILSPVYRHYIIVTNILDVQPLPGNKSPVYCQFCALPRYHFIETKLVTFTSSRLTRLCISLRCDFLHSILDDISNITLCFIPHFPHKSITHTKVITHPVFDANASAFLLDTLKSRTKVPLTLVWCPVVPSIKNNSVYFKDAEAAEAHELMLQCERRGIDFINMKDAFCTFYKKHLAFVRGFPNSEPGTGHMNADGNNLVALAIFNSLISKEINP